MSYDQICWAEASPYWVISGAVCSRALLTQPSTRGESDWVCACVQTDNIYEHLLWACYKTENVSTNKVLFCITGYVRDDCSLHESAVPVISRFRRGCKCDVREFKCARVFITATNIYSSGNPTCRVQSASSTVDGQSSSLPEIAEVNICHLKPCFCHYFNHGSTHI